MKGKNKKIERGENRTVGRPGLMLLAMAVLVVTSMFVVIGAPIGPDSLAYNWNTTKNVTSALTINISGGVISSFNLTASVQNTRWKAFVGQVFGSFTLDDSNDNTIYDWSFATMTGRVYATRNATTPSWGSVACASTANLETENTGMSHTGASDNITATFNDTIHAEFYVGVTQFVADDCNHTVNTYNSTGQSEATLFEEVALYDGVSVFYTGLLEEDATGFDGSSYDFQMIVPENGSAGFDSATPYYLYIELGN